MTDSIVERIKHGTEELFTQAVNLSFEPVARLGGDAVLSLFEQYKDQSLSGDTATSPEDDLQNLDLYTVNALGALHTLVEARRTNLHEIEFEDEKQKEVLDNFYVASAPVLVIAAVTKAQQALAKRSDNMYRLTQP